MQENTLIYLQNIQLLFSVYIIPKNTNVPTTCPCFPALPGFSVFRIFCKSLRWSLHEELHHSDREEIRHPQLPDWSHRRQLRNGFVFRPWPRHIKSAEPELFTPSVTKPFFLSSVTGRKPLGRGLCELLWRQAPSSQADRYWLCDHGVGILPRDSASLPAGAVSTTLTSCLSFVLFSIV